MEPDIISVRGAREHNLKHVDVDIPKYKLVVITGVSGSGKSSLAFDTLFAEGQRRYVESLSAYARQFLGQLSKPGYDAIRGLSPTIAIEQKSASMNPRSTVGTVTEIYDYLRVLFARAGTAHCPECGVVVRRYTPPEIVERLLALPDGSRWTLLAPLASGDVGPLTGIAEAARRDGFARLRVDGRPLELDGQPPPILEPAVPHTVDVVIDRVAIRDGARPRLTDSIETALRYGKGVVIVAPADGSADLRFSERNRCDACDVDLDELSPQLFSFNSPLGMCASCKGLGTAFEVDPVKLVPDPDLSLDEGAIQPWASLLDPTRSSLTGELIQAVCDAYDIRRDRAWASLDEGQRAVLLNGTDGPVKFTTKRAHGTFNYEMPFEGVARIIERRYKETKSDAMRQVYMDYMSSSPCRECGGSRLNLTARHVRFADRHIADLVMMPVEELHALFGSLDLSGNTAVVAGDAVREISSRLRFLAGVGLGYLSLSRAAGTLSGGESQRIRLASQIGTELTGVLYILDEPSIGLHQRDNQRLIEALARLRDIGNSVLVVEHDEAIMRAADWIIDMGPGAGRNGGSVVAQGTARDLMADLASPTGAYLSGRSGIVAPATRRVASGWLTIAGARENNLKDIDVALPLGVFTVVTGVSGAGKSSLVNGILEPALRRRLYGSALHPGDHDEIRGLGQLDKVVTIDQQPIGRTPRSNPATYTKVFDDIRTLYASTRESKMYGYTPGRFSFNVKGGRCEACAGDGVKKVEMHFLADVYVTCEVCGGRRFNEATLRVRYKGRDIADVLDLTVSEGLEFFENHQRIRRVLQTLDDVGLGYVQLGQSSTTLSGGEAQRVKLSRELAKVQTGRTLYILDEPTTGLHFQDIERLLAVVQRLVDAGNTVLMIEHNLDLIKSADHLVDLGPEGGGGGGRVVAEGTPEQVARVAASYTGQCLAGVLAGSP
ncbi:MAG: excinuclease ABC subunit UvrA [Deltaproteobacteria bacterium HGW-Deltaproteobacteria-14]|jgi:excinuclease ABC subunit A|nr:MAG: excinuclease ABC subunit UvrA [Deltaproteobacteria bacterium HGW-Deltaproteobacteria-14]